jgi:hypothetical protein
VVLDKLKQKLSATVPCSGSLSSSPPVDWDSPTARRSIRTVVNESVDGKTKKLLSRLTCELLSTKSHLTLAKLEEKRAFDALRAAQKKHKRSKKLMEEFRASEDRGAVVFTSSKVRKLLDLQKAREQAKEQQKVDKALKAQQTVAAKELKARETQKRKDDRLAASAARKKAAADAKAAGKAARDALEAQKKREQERKALNRRLRGRPASPLASCSPFLLTRSPEFCLRMQTCQLFDECFILLPLPILCSLWAVRWKQSVKFTSCCATRVNCLVRLCQDSSSLPGYAKHKKAWPLVDTGPPATSSGPEIILWRHLRQC